MKALSIVTSLALTALFGQAGFAQMEQSGRGFEAFKRNVYPLIHGTKQNRQCAECHDNGGKGPNHSSSDPWISYQKVLSYTNFGNLSASKFIVKGTNGHPASYGGNVTVTQEQLVAAFQKWWNEGENTSFLEGKKVLPGQRMPRLPDDGGFVEMTWDLSEVDASLQGIRFAADIQRFMKSGNGHMGAYRLRNPRFHIIGNQNVQVSGIHVVMNGAYDPLANNYSEIQMVAGSEQSLSKSYQIVTEKQGGGRDQIAFAFEKIQATNQAPQTVPSLIKKSRVSAQSSLEAFNEAKAGISARFVPIQVPVQFEMGSVGNTDTNNGGLHKVKLTKPFEIQATEVTQYQWYVVMQGTQLKASDGKDIRATPSHFKSQEQCDPKEFDSSLSICKNHPVEQVSWNDIKVFIYRLNQMQASHTYRLPTEAEWEYVARAGLPSEYSYGFGGDFDGSYAWYSGNSGNRTHKVASTPHGVPSPSNPEDIIYDMHGNVSEWVQDWYESSYGLNTQQLLSETTNPTGPTTPDPFRVVRGGNQTYDPQYLRSAYHSGIRSDFRYNYIGFRLVRTVSAGVL